MCSSNNHYDNNLGDILKSYLYNNSFIMNRILFLEDSGAYNGSIET